MDRGSLALALAAVLAACGQTPPGLPGDEDHAQWSAPGNGVVVSRDGETVRYSGEITKAGFAAVKALTDKRPVRTLEIDSMGGEVMTGMDFGDWVHDRHVEVIVDTLCLSSCANYVFPAAPVKTIRPGGLVAWHGSARQRGLMRLMEAAVDAKVNTLALPPAQKEERRKQMWHNTQAYMRTAQARQDAFFARIGVDEQITRIGNDQYGVKGLFFLSVPGMARFGVKGVTAPRDYAHMDVTPLVRRTGAAITYVSLQDGPH